MSGSDGAGHGGFRLVVAVKSQQGLAGQGLLWKGGLGWARRVDEWSTKASQVRRSRYGMMRNG